MSLSHVLFVFVCLAADVVTSPGTSKDLFDQAGSQDKTFKLYDGAFHSLTMEKDDVFAEIWGDMSAWLQQRS